MSASRTTKKELLSLLARIATTLKGNSLDPLIPYDLYDDIILTLKEAKKENE